MRAKIVFLLLCFSALSACASRLSHEADSGRSDHFDGGEPSSSDARVSDSGLDSNIDAGASDASPDSTDACTPSQCGDGGSCVLDASRTGCETPSDAERNDPSRVWAFLLAGQSNMQGNVDQTLATSLLSELGSGPSNTKQTRVAQALDTWYQTFNNGYARYAASPEVSANEAAQLDQLSSAAVVGNYLTEPRDDVLCSRNGALPAPLAFGCGNPFGPELTLGRMAGETLTGPVALTKVVEGGTTLYAEWLSPSAATEHGRSTGRLYLKLAEQMHALAAAGTKIHPRCADGNCRWDAFVWFQGENDGFSAASGAEYESNLRHLVADVRKDTGNPELPVVIVQIGYWAKTAASSGLAVHGAQARIAAEDPHVSLVVTDDLSRFYHYDPAAQWIIGARIGVALGQRCAQGDCPTPP